MSFASEFAVVDLVRNSNFETSGVDAFALSVLKMERQLRRLFTYLVYQSDAFGPADVESLKAELGRSSRIYYEGFERGVDALCTLSVEELVGQDYSAIRPIVDDAVDVRNKVFHGQLTDRCLLRDDLEGLTTEIRRWCMLLAEGAARELGYDGFGRNSFRKKPPEVPGFLQWPLDSVAAYGVFLKQHVERRRQRAN